LNSLLGRMGISPMSLPNFFSRESCTSKCCTVLQVSNRVYNCQKFSCFKYRNRYRYLPQQNRIQGKIKFNILGALIKRNLF
jgi:hypothetical protein